MTRAGAFLGLLLAMTAVAPAARGQDTATAVALFDRGLADMQAGKFETGCPALEESFRLDPLAGVLFTSAECHAQWGAVATAMARYQDYVSRFSRMSPSEQARQRGRDEIAKKRIAELEPKVPLLTLTLPASAPPDTKVSRSGTVLGAPSLGVALPVDPGEHVVVTEVPGAEPRETRFSVEAGERKTVELAIALPDRPPSAPEEQAGPSAPADAAPAGSGPRTAAYVVGAMGVAGLVVGSVSGALALGRKGVVDEHCDGAICDAEGKDAADEGQTFGLVSTIGFGVGVVGVGVAAVLLATSPKSAPAESHGLRPLAAMGPKGAVLGVGGSFR